jgi:hypothetical protein
LFIKCTFERHAVADRLLAVILHQRLALPQVAIAVLFSVRPETINKRIRDIRARHRYEFPERLPRAVDDQI